MSETASSSDEQPQPPSKRVVQSAFSSKAPRNTSAGTTAPFNTCLATLITMGIVLQITAIASSFGSYFAVFLTLFAFEWFNIHFSSMTRTKRACFDIANVLETYQPRARTHGHLFVPDPPTPCVKIADDTDGHDMPKEKNAFMNARDSHYENMYQKALQMAKEMEQMEKNAASPSMDGGQSNVELTEANPEKDKKESDEKAQKAKKKYDDDMSKPFSC